MTSRLVDEMVGIFQAQTNGYDGTLCHIYFERKMDRYKIPRISSCICDSVGATLSNKTFDIS